MARRRRPGWACNGNRTGSALRMTILYDRSREDGSEPSLLKISGLSKRFTATLALDKVDFDLRRGEIHALLGQNGAGKSTLIKILADIYKADAGEISFNGRGADGRLGELPIAFIHQDLGLVHWMPLADNG